MQLSNKAVKEFQALYEKYFSQKLSFEAAKFEAEKLIKIVALTQPSKRERDKNEK